MRFWLVSSFGLPVVGIVTDESALIAPLEEQFDAVWRGDFCMDCGRKDYCIDPIKDDV